MKPDLQQMTDDILVKYLVGEATQQEREQVESWLAKDTANKDYFEGFIQIWQQSLALAPQLSVDKKAAWERFHAKAIERPLKQALPLHKRMSWLRIAALLLVAALGAVSFWIVNSNTLRKPVEVVSTTNSLTDTLPDGSVVVLNKHSGLIYPKQFDTKQRNVQLKGEGFFSVAHNTAQPFTVACNGINIKVVGTSFNVKTVAGGTEVIVETGRVLVSRGNQSVLLLPGERLVADSANSTLNKTVNADRLYKYYRNREIICDATPLWQLVQVLNDAYDVNIVIDNKALAKLPISTTFNNEPLDKILAVIAETLSVHVEKKQDSILLK